MTDAGQPESSSGQRFRSAVVIPAAGRGTRLGTNQAKQYLQLNGRSVLDYSVRAFWHAVDDIIIVISEGAEDDCRAALAQLPDPSRPRLVLGGTTRQASVSHGLRVLDPSVEAVLVHDAARPFISESIIDQALVALRQHAAVVVAVPCSSTVKRSHDGEVVSETVDRSDLWLAQTPQGFQLSAGLAAFEQALAQAWHCTDDAEVMERAGHVVHMVRGRNDNFKITHPGDLEMAAAILAQRRPAQT